jgi:periplasmic copper chaperone A
VRLVFAVLVLLTSSALAAATSGPSIRGTWVEEGPPTAKALAGYFTLKNDATPRALIGGASPEFARVEIHRTEAVAGTFRMVAVKRLALKAGEEMRFAPGGFHLMLLKPKHPLRAGDQVRIVLRFSDGAARELTFPVKRDGDLAR